MNVLIIGRGNVGSALRRALKARGDLDVTTAGHTVRRTQVQSANVILLTVPDTAIRPVAESIASHVQPGQVVLHCAGARGTEELTSCASRGAATGVMHPLVSFPNRKTNPPLPGTTFVVHGAPRANRTARTIAKACGARAIAQNVSGAAYHAAAALVANGAAAIAFEGVRILRKIGFEQRDAERAIGGLMRSVGDNVERIGVPDALTGPIARGDAATVRHHRGALAKLGKGPRAAYDAVGPVILECAKAAGLGRRRATEVARALRQR